MSVNIGSKLRAVLTMPPGGSHEPIIAELRRAKSEKMTVLLKENHKNGGNMKEIYFYGAT